MAVVRSPRLWLGVQLAAIVAVGASLGAWRLQIHPDSASYISASKMALGPALSQMRTLGYPLLLRMVAVVSPDYSIIPWFHLAMLGPAAFLLDAAVRRFGFAPWEAFVVSSGFVFGAIQQPWTVASLLTDFPATMFAGMAISCLFWVASTPSDLRGWLGLTFFVASAYQIRPAYLFLVGLVPCMGLLLAYVRVRWIGEPFRWRKLLTGLVVVCIIPLAAFCSFRWAVVGDFGLVSFGGSTLGMAAELLDRETAEVRLSSEFQPFAREILIGRQERELKSAFAHRWWVDMRAYEDNYSTSIYLIGYPAARKRFGNDPIELNREIARFSREVMVLQRGRYLRWTVFYWPRAAAKVLYRYRILQAAVPATLILLGLNHCYGRRRWRASPPGAGLCRRITPALPAAVLLAVFYFGGSITLLILAGSYADSRLVCPAAVFVPSLVGLILLREVERFRSARASVRREAV